MRFHYIEKGKGPLILFLHGFPEFSYSWRKQVDYFGEKYHAVAPDMRGYNLSDKPEGVEAYHIKNIIADIEALSRQFSDRKFTLVAHDWGGAAAWAFALAHQERLERMIILNGPHPATFLRELCINEAQIEASQYIRMFRTPEAEVQLLKGNCEWLLNFAFGDLEKSGVLTEDDRLAYINAWRQPGALTGGLNWYRASAIGVPEAFDPQAKPIILDKETYKISIPTLVIWGEKDTALLPQLLDGLEDYVSDLTIKKIPQANHWVVQEYPDIVNQYINEFIAEPSA
ncbi:MAG: alpha/beta hydrolase [Rhodospirillales bacterium]|nr:alpha/beta hydrolase [Rhodospirillales bacterium]